MVSAKQQPVVLVLCEPTNGLEVVYPTWSIVGQSGEVPLGLLYVAAACENHGFEVIVLDNSVDFLTHEELANKILAFDPLLVGFSVTVLSQRICREVSRLIKFGNPSIPIVWGGPHVTISPMRAATLDLVDYVVCHEGERPLLELAVAARSGRLTAAPSPELKIRQNQTFEDLDELPFPARHLIDISQYRRKSYVIDASPTDSLCSSRGCPFACTFCSSKAVWQRSYRARSPERVVDEIEHLVNSFGSRSVYFREDNFTASRKHVRAICQVILARGLKVQWECESRVDTVGPEDLALMAKAGCSGIWCGVESGSDRILDSVSKGITAAKVANFFQQCKEVGIETGACFMLGFPGETAVDILRTKELAERLPSKWSVFATYIGFPGSELYSNLARTGLWEDQWEDVLIARSQAFTASQIFALEEALRREIETSGSKPGGGMAQQIRNRIAYGKQWLSRLVTKQCRPEGHRQDFHRWLRDYPEATVLELLNAFENAKSNKAVMPVHPTEHH